MEESINKNRPGKKIEKMVHLMSKIIPDYRDLKEIKIKDGEKTVLSFYEFVEKYNRPPEFILESG